MTQQIGIGIIGAGGISHSHALAYRSSMNRDLARVVAIADISEAAVSERAEQYKIDKTYSDWHDLIADPAVHAISICTPPFLHVEQACAALRAGKHVLCEKPVSPTLAGLDEIAAAEQEGGAIFAGVFQHRVGQGAQQLKALIDDGHFGKLVFGLSETLWQRGDDYYSVWWRGTWEQECGGVTMGHGIHSIDMLAWLFGEPESLIADVATVKLDIQVEDTSLATVRFKNGAVGQIIVTVNAQDNRSRLEIFGSDLQAIVTSDDPYAPTSLPFKLSSVDPQVAARAEETATAAAPNPTKHLHVPMANDFLRAIIEGRPPLVSTSECRRSMELISGLYKSAMTGARVNFPVAPEDPWYRSIPAV